MRSNNADNAHADTAQEIISICVYWALQPNTPLWRLYATLLNEVNMVTEADKAEPSGEETVNSSVVYNGALWVVPLSLFLFSISASPHSHPQEKHGGESKCQLEKWAPVSSFSRNVGTAHEYSL